MTTRVNAPDIPNAAYPKGGYPSGGAKLGPAWTAIWRELAKDPDTFHDAYPIVDKVAAKHELAPATLIGLIKRAATAGLLERTSRMVNTGKRGNRARTHYRIAEPEEIFKS